jgi:DnaK suppressor protein
MLTREDLERVEKRLRAEREDALEAIRHFDDARGQTLQDEAGELSIYRFHMADIATEAMEREKQFLLASKEGERLYEIDEALRRLYKDPETFGTCARCGAEIGMDRLMVVPSARLCAACASASED